MQRLTEILLGLDRGFLARDGDFALTFRPRWPLQEMLGAASWNLLLVAAAVALVVWVYRREGKGRGWRIALGTGRLAVLLLIIVLLNRPTLSLTKARVEPSVLAVLVDDSASMSVQDVPAGDESPVRRIDEARRLVASDSELVQRLGQAHQLRFFRFGESARPVDASALADVEAESQRTDVASSVADVLDQLRGQNLAGTILLTDGRDAPARSERGAQQRIRSAGVGVYPVPVGGPGEPRNVQVESVAAEPTVFAGDILNVLARVRATGFEEPTDVTLRLIDGGGNPVLDPDGNPVVTTATVGDRESTEVELQLETQQPELLNLAVVAESGVQEIDLEDNRRGLRVDVLDAQIAVLYVDGYPRWEYRYLKNRLIRDETINASILLTSADPTFSQEGNTPIRRFPVTMDELLNYDVVLLGDVDPRQFSDGQLELLREFVGDMGGGFGMIAGPRSSPWAWTGTPVEALLPVDIAAEPSQSASTLAEGWRPVVTAAGERTGMFRFFADKEQNEQFLETGLEELFWWADGIRPKAGVGDVLAEHPDAMGPDGRPAALLVAGRYGAGRTLFNGIDDSWRWRYYTGEGVFDTFWVQQLRYLARGRKLGERRATLSINRPTYELGEQVQAEMRLLDPQLAQQLPDRLDGELVDAEGRAIRTIVFTRRGGESTEGDRFTADFRAERLGSFALRVPPLAPEVPELSANVAVALPQAELERPAVDHAALSRLAAETGGELVSLSEVNQLPELIPSLEKRVPVVTDRSLWDAPLALAVLAMFLTLEWVGRKAAGLV